jgi:hypothetical protein
MLAVEGRDHALLFLKRVMNKDTMASIEVGKASPQDIAS